MSRHSQISFPGEDKEIVRTIIYFIISIIIVLSSLVILFVNTNNLKTNITECIDENSELIETSNNLILEIGTMQRRLLAMAVVSDERDEKRIMGRWYNAVDSSGSFHSIVLHQLKSNKEFSEHFPIINTLPDIRAKYLVASREFVGLLKSKAEDQIVSEFLLKELGPKFKKYRITQLKIGSLIHEKFIEESQEITRKSSFVVWCVFGIGVFPFFFLGYRLFKK